MQSEAIEEIQGCPNSVCVKRVFKKYESEPDLLELDANGNKIVAVEFQQEARKKLGSFNLSDTELKDCLEWLPPAKTSLNVIVIPDLSRRIINISDQVKNDTIVLNTIWKAFVEYSKFRQDTKDQLIIDVTDTDQAKGQFKDVADDLLFDLSGHTGKSNRLYFTDEKTKQFKAAIAKMYESAKQKPLGADYLLYFKRNLIDRIKKSTLFDNYKNKVIIITDGYLETEELTYTKLTSQLYDAVKVTGNAKRAIKDLELTLPEAQGLDLSDTDILVCEVTEREKGKKKDFEILKAYWEDWLSRMKAHEISFIQKEQATKKTEEKIKEFIKD